MSTTKSKEAPTKALPRTRLSRDARYRQLVDIAWRLVREEGTDALTLGRLAERSGVTKPVVYDHFATRSGLLAALYQEYDARQTALMDAALTASKPTLNAKATVIASAYIDCVLTQGREVPGVSAALAGSPELDEIIRNYHIVFIEKCRVVLSPFAKGKDIPLPGLWAMLGAAESLSNAAAIGHVTAAQARDELFETIVAMVNRSARGDARQG